MRILKQEGQGCIKWVAAIGAGLALLALLVGQQRPAAAERRASHPHPRPRAMQVNSTREAETQFLPSSAAESGDAQHKVYLPFITYYEPPELPLYRLRAEPADLEWLYDDDNRWSYETVPAVFIYQDTSYDVQIRFRGGTTRYLSKKSWKVIFPGATPFLGQRELNLNAEYPDKSLMREALGYDLFKRAGLPAPETQYVQLEINGAHMGLFLQVEQVDQRFLDRIGWDPNGNLYKGDYGGDFDWGGVDYAASYVKKTNEEDSHADIIDLLWLINLTPDADLPAALTSVLDVGTYLDWYAVQIALGNYEWLEKNYYIYHELGEDWWEFLPWDLDLILGHNWGKDGIMDRDISWDNPIDSGTWWSPKADGIWNKLISRVLDIEVFRFAYCRRLQELMHGEFAADAMYARIDAIYRLITPYAEADPYKWGTDEEFHDGPDELMTYVANRLAWLSDEIPGYCPDNGPMPLINELMSDSTSTLADEAGDYEPWIELYNPGLVSFDVGGMSLQTTPTVTARSSWTIPEDSVIPPGGFLLIWADEEPEEGPLHANLGLNAEGGKITLYDKAVYGGQVVDEQDYGPLAPDLSFGRIDDGGATWITFRPATPGWSNLGRAPLITATGHTPVEPGDGEPVTVTAIVSDTDSSAGLTVTLRWASDDVTQASPMYDDGAHGDGATQDGRYGAVIPAMRSGVVVTYCVQAEDSLGLISSDPPRAPKVNHGYRVGFQRPPLYLNELVAINQDTLEDEMGESDDWFEIYNAGPVTVSLGGMYLTDAIENSTKWQIPAGVTVGPGGYVLFWADNEPDQGATHVNFKLNGDGERLALYAGPENYKGLVDEVYYGPQTMDQPWGRYPDGEATWRGLVPTPGQGNRQPGPTISQLGHMPVAPGADQTVTMTAIIQDEGAILSATLYYSVGQPFIIHRPPSALAQGFQAVPLQHVGEGLYSAQIPPRPEDTTVTYYVWAQDELGEIATYPDDAPAVTYGYRVGHARPALFINEFLASNGGINQDEAGEYEDWIELHNAGDEALDIGGMYLTDDLSQPTKWRIPEGTSIPPQGYLLVWADDEAVDGPLHANFKLSRRGEEIGLFDRDAGANTPIDSVIFGPQTTDLSTGRWSDGSAIWRIFESPTPGESNTPS